MKLTRYGFNRIVLIWLLPLGIIDVIGNLNTTGYMSDVYYFKVIFDGLLILFAGYMAFFAGETMTRGDAHVARLDPSDTVAEVGDIGNLEHIYCALLVVVALGSWYVHHDINRNSTGIVALASLIWSFLDLIVAVLAGLQFWHLKSGAIVNVSRKMVQ